MSQLLFSYVIRPQKDINGDSIESVALIFWNDVPPLLLFSRGLKIIWVHHVAQSKIVP